MNSKTLSLKQLQDLMTDFVDLVSDSHYIKTPYDKWRLLKKIHGSATGVVTDNYSKIELYDLDTSVTFSVSDNSFGQFLAENLFKIKTLNVKASDYPSLTVSNASTVCASFGVNVCDSTGTYRNISDVIDDLSKKYDTLTNKNKKENNTMKGFNFDFGPCTNDAVRMSMYGVAVKNTAGIWVSYNAKDKSIIDVDVFNFDGGKYMFKMPVSISDVMIGDVIIHNRVPMFVTDVTADNKIVAVDVRAGEEKSVIPTTNMFGFNFITKIVSMFNALGDAPTPDAPFGNMLPFLMMGENGSEDFDPMLMFMMTQGTGGSGSDMFSNPMMLYFLMKDKDGSNDNMLPLMMMRGAKK